MMTVNFTIEPVGGKENADKYLLLVEGRPYYVGALVKELLTLRAQRFSTPDIVGKLNEWARGTYSFSTSEVNGLLTSYIQKMGVNFDATTSAALPKRSMNLSGVIGQWTILSYERMKPIVGVLRHAFYPAVFYPILLIAVILNVYFVSELTTLYNNLQALRTGTEMGAAAGAVAGACGKDMVYVLLFYPAAFGLLLLHELGHAASAYHFGVKPKKVGAGFYMIFPVLFADITEAWKLSRNHRIIVNMGGIFFQLLVNLVLIYLVYHTSNFESVRLVRYLMILNISTMVLNLNFVLKFDGYWIYSDLFKLPNLSQQSLILTGMAAEKIIPGYHAKIPAEVRKKVAITNPFLIFYTLFRTTFFAVLIVALFYYIFPMLGGNLSKAGGYIAAGDFSVCSLEFLGRTAVTTGVGCYLGYKYGSRLVKSVRRRRS
jgi:putative peptide zinc metalloprotease protein